MKAPPEIHLESSVGVTLAHLPSQVAASPLNGGQAQSMGTGQDYGSVLWLVAEFMQQGVHQNFRSVEAQGAQLVLETFTGVHPDGCKDESASVKRKVNLIVGGSGRT